MTKVAEDLSVKVELVKDFLANGDFDDAYKLLDQMSFDDFESLGAAGEQLLLVKEVLERRAVAPSAKAKENHEKQAQKLAAAVVV